MLKSQRSLEYFLLNHFDEFRRIFLSRKQCYSTFSNSHRKFSGFSQSNFSLHILEQVPEGRKERQKEVRRGKWSEMNKSIPKYSIQKRYNNIKQMRKAAKKLAREFKEQVKGGDNEIDGMIEHLTGCKPLADKQLKILCEKSKEIFMKESNVVPVRPPIIICGDVHGQFPDLMELLSLGGRVSDHRYLFLGDYVDRGHYSVETISLLLAYKVKYPDNITLIRGNHESRLTTKDYGFYDQIESKYGNHEPWKWFMDVFDSLPLCALVDNKFLCMHGGLSPHIKTIDQIRSLDRHQEVPLESAMTDILWSDPSQSKGFSQNNGRGVAHYFGPDITDKFTHNNHIKCIARAHEVAMKGYQLTHDRRVTTIFSAPNYCYRCGNKGAIMELDNEMHGHFYMYGQHDEYFGEQNPKQKKVPKHFT